MPLDQISGLPQRVLALAHERGFTHVVGRPRRFSQYGHAYFLTVNMAEHEEGSNVDYEPIDGTLGRWSQMLDAAKERGQTWIVWRRGPDLEWLPERDSYRVYARFHFISPAEAAAHAEPWELANAA